mmetsp:Transcript_42277/g.88781  ORF Transcript_42277/g.88781 Transcript_42277/m.88781 type:complete len:226 (+) Transcript_42277:3073-3750(+)
MQVALLLYTVDLPLQHKNPIPQDTLIDLQLRLSRTTQSHSARTRLTFQMSPHSSEAGFAIFVQSEVDLEFSLAGFSVLCEDVKDERRAVDHFHNVVLRAPQEIVLNDLCIECILKRLLLSGIQFCIKHNGTTMPLPSLFQLSIDLFQQRLGLLNLTRPNVGPWIDFLQPLRDFPSQRETRSFDEFSHFNHGLFEGPCKTEIVHGNILFIFALLLTDQFPGLARLR